ncbi:unnamed protein product [Schistosoma mattheei]|uniref:tRNA synthetases class I (E and Q) anti-codon binding domain-containing protein n=1 Tax=Schistosoma mattheei TaxID=31246 RepID=A0A3P8HSI2_9TREM|nr:unnamed protein product [Schistosoma mattheei]
MSLNKLQIVFICIIHFRLRELYATNFHIVQNSLVIIPGALIEQSVKNAEVYTAYQFERIGFFSVDPDTNSERDGFQSNCCSKSRSW